MKSRNYGLKTADGQWIKTLTNDNNFDSILAFETKDEAEEYKNQRELKGLTIEELK